MSEPTSSSPRPPEDESWREQRRRQRQQEEKDEEKSEKFTRDPISGIVWALIFISAGLILLIDSMGLINWELYGGAWNPILIVAGLVLLFEVALRLLVPAYRRPVSGTLILAFVLIGIGLSGLLGSDVIWPLVLIAIGVAFVIGALFRGR